MAVRPIRVFGDPVLRSSTDSVEPTGQTAALLVTDLIDTVKEPGRAGVAANQIGVGLRAFSYNIDGNVGYLLNPTLVEVTGVPALVDEGCLSIPGLSFPRLRYPGATARGFLLDGTEVTVSGSGLMAQALQHELDHLDGVLYIEGLDPETKREALRQIRSASWFRRG